MATTEPITTRGKAKLMRGGVGRYTVVLGAEETGHEEFMDAWSDFLTKSGWKDAPPADTKRR